MAKIPKKVSSADKLNPRQEIFCRLYASPEYFCNGVRAYLAAFQDEGGKKITYESAKNGAYVLLTNNDILARVRELVDIVVNDVMVDKELGKVVAQDADFRAKVSGIKEYNRLKKRVDERSQIYVGALEEEQKKKIDSLLELYGNKPRNTASHA